MIFWIYANLALLCCSVAANCFFFVTGRPRWLTMALWREAYRRGIVAGRNISERKWLHRKAVELHDAGRRSDARSDAGPPAHVSKIRFQSGK
jgi:hypothetical protein